MVQVKIYTTPTCHYCLAAKEFFKEKKIKYVEVDLTKDHKAAVEMIEKTNQRGVPVIIIGKNKPIIGFDQEEIEEALGL